MQNQNIVQKIQLHKISDGRGNLSFLEENKQIPFKIDRVSWINHFSVDKQVEKITEKIQKEIIIALSGTFDVVIMEPFGNKTIYKLNSPHSALFIPSKISSFSQNYSKNALSLHLIGN